MRTHTNRANLGAPIVTPREMWLASLGAVVVTREWAGNEAGPLFRSLVKEGTIIETRAVRIVGEGIETSFERANSLWHRARTTVTSTVKSYADTAVAIARELPRSLPRIPRIELGGVTIPEAPAKRRVRRSAKAVKASAAGAAKKVRRTAKRATKRG